MAPIFKGPMNISTTNRLERGLSPINMMCTRFCFEIDSSVMSLPHSHSHQKKHLQLLYFQLILSKRTMITKSAHPKLNNWHINIYNKQVCTDIRKENKSHSRKFTNKLLLPTMVDIFKNGQDNTVLPLMVKRLSYRERQRTHYID